MCGRFTLKTPVANWLADLFPNWHEGVAFANENVPIELTRARYNIAPSQSILVFHVDSDGQLRLEGIRWGLLPSWADALSVGYNMINARSESIADKPSFRPSLVNPWARRLIFTHFFLARAPSFGLSTSTKNNGSWFSMP